MTTHNRKPLIGICADRKMIGAHPFHCVGEKYIAAIVDGADAVPVIIPSLGQGDYLEIMLKQIDALFLTGSVSNIEPQHYAPDTAHVGPVDAHRDATTLPLIRRIVDMGMPLLAICRGFQEMNVAYGGTLWTNINETTHLHNHREDTSAPLEVQYGPAHDVELLAGGQLQRMLGTTRLAVNSLHGQGVRELASALQPEAMAPDGLVEAFSVRAARTFALGVQWHPEWKIKDNPASLALFSEFGRAARDYAQR